MYMMTKKKFTYPVELTILTSLSAVEFLDFHNFKVGNDLIHVCQ